MELTLLTTCSALDLVKVGMSVSNYLKNFKKTIKDIKLIIIDKDGDFGLKVRLLDENLENMIVFCVPRSNKAIEWLVGDDINEKQEE